MTVLPEPRNPPDTDRAAARRRSARRIAPLVVVALASILFFATGWHRYLSFENLARHYDAILAFVGTHWAEALAAYVVLYIVTVALSVPGAAFLTICGGLLFGLVIGSLAAIVAATAGATLIFLIAKTAVGEHLVRRAGPKVAKVADGFRQDAFNYLLFLRLVPVFPFWLVNILPALIGVRLTTFVAATVIGIIPGTLAFALVGVGFDSVIVAQQEAYQTCLAQGRNDCLLAFDPGAAVTPELLLALVALGVLALIPVAVRRWRGRQRAKGNANA